MAAQSSSIVSATTDLGFFVIRDLRLGRRNSGLCEQKIVVGGSGLVDHCWSSRIDQALLAYSDGSLACVDTRTGRAICVCSSPGNLDSIDWHGSSSTLAAFGTGATLLSLQSGVLESIARYSPKFERAEHNAGAFSATGQLYITAADGSLVLLEPFAK